MKRSTALVIWAALFAGCAPPGENPGQGTAVSGQGGTRQNPAVGQRQNNKPVTREAELSEQEIRAQFKLLADEWARHCQKWINSSNPDDYLKCPAYRGLVALGKPAVPLIMEIYGLENEETDPRSWEYALDEITGLRFI